MPVLIFNELQRSSQVPSVVHHMNADRRPGAEFKGRRQSDDPANTLFSITGPFAALTDPVLLFEGSKIKNGNIAGLDTAHDPDLVGNLREIVFRVQKDNVSDRVATSTLLNKRERISSDPVGINPHTRHWKGCYDRRWRAGCYSRVQGTLSELVVFSDRLRLGDSRHGEYPDDNVDKEVDLTTKGHDRLANMHQLARTFANHANAQHFTGFKVEDQL
jgi:hypothetical protein